VLNRSTYISGQINNDKRQNAVKKARVDTNVRLTNTYGGKFVKLSANQLIGLRTKLTSLLSEVDLLLTKVDKPVEEPTVLLNVNEMAKISLDND
jgi:hypothetical protein